MVIGENKAIETVPYVITLWIYISTDIHIEM